MPAFPRLRRYCLYSSILASRPGRLSVTSGMLWTLVLPMLYTVTPAASYRRLISMNPSAVRIPSGAPTLTYAAPSCWRNSRSSADGLADDWTQSLMPGAAARTNETTRGSTSAAAPNVPNASLPKSRLASFFVFMGALPVPEQSNKTKRPELCRARHRIERQPGGGPYACRSHSVGARRGFGGPLGPVAAEPVRRTLEHHGHRP